MILVTGGAGFIGSNITATLAERGVPVAVCDRFRRGDKWRNLSKLQLQDVVAPEALTQWLEAHGEAVEAIVHMGAISSTTETDVDLIIEVNFRLSTQLWRWCAAHGKRLIYASSAATYGAGEHGFELRIREPGGGSGTGLFCSGRADYGAQHRRCGAGAGKCVPDPAQEREAG